MKSDNGARGINPEQLFAAGYSACFAGALGVVARTQGVNPGPFTISADVTFLKGGYGIGVKLIGTFPELERSARTRRPRAATFPSSSPSRELSHHLLSQGESTTHEGTLRRPRGRRKMRLWSAYGHETS